MTETLIPPTPSRDDNNDAPRSFLQTLLSRTTRLEIVIGAVIAVVMGALVVIEPNILEAPFENANTILFTLGGTAIAAVAFGVMLWLRVPALIRIVVLVVPFVFVNWWLLSPYFIDDVVDEQFSTSISEQVATGSPAAPPAPAGDTGGTEATGDPAAAPTADANTETGDEAGTDAGAGESAGSAGDDAPAAGTDGADTASDAGDDADSGAAPAADDAAAEEPAAEEPPVETAPPAPTGPVLLGAGQFVGLAGHDGTGDAGLFQNPDGSFTLRFENFDIENGPDLEVYLVPGADQVSLPEGSIGLGELKGNIGDQNYELPAGTELASGSWTALVWCEAFSVEFVGATITIP